MSRYLVAHWKAVCRNLGDNPGTSLLNDLELGNCITWCFLITHFLEHLGCAKHCPKNFNSITWLNPHYSRMMSTCFFPVYSYRCTLWGLKRLNNLPEITEPVCGAGRDTPQAPTSRLSLGGPRDLLQTTSHSVSLCQRVDHARGVQARFTYKALHLLPPVQRSL